MSSEIEYNEIFREIGDLLGVKADNVQLRADLAQADEDRQNSAAEIIRLRGELAAWQEAFGTDTPEQSAISVSRRLEDAGRVAAELHTAVDALKLWDGIGFDFWLTDDEWSGREPDQDDEREWVNLSGITREIVAAYDAKYPEVKG